MVLRVAVAAAVLGLAVGARAESVRQDFSGAGTPYVLSRHGAGPGALVTAGALRLIDDEEDQSNAVTFSRCAVGAREVVRASWSLSVTPGGNGMSFALLNTAEYGLDGAAPSGIAWDEPKLKRSLAVAFDILDQPNNDPFRGDGNIYNRPQREIALFYDGREIARKLSPVEFRTGKPVPVTVEVRAVCGGCEVTVTVAGTRVYDRHLVANLEPYESRAAFGAQSGKYWTTLAIDDVRVDWGGRVRRRRPPTTVRAIDGVVLDAARGTHAETVRFPDNTDGFGRIICTLTLGEPPAGYDPWDRCASVYAYDEAGAKFEIVRFITPYRRGFTWLVDVTDYRPLLTGTRKVEASIGTYGPGWKVTVDFTFHPGRAERLARKIETLWVGRPEIGNPDKPVAEFYRPVTLTPDRKWRGAKLRIYVTGHGMSPNSRNAAEFMPITRWVTVNGKRFENRLWKTDCYLNPCRPQGGTWKYDRAGWAPGDVVPPWEVDLTPAVRSGRPIALTYELEPYLNENRGKTTPPTHWTEAQVVWYAK